LRRGATSAGRVKVGPSKDTLAISRLICVGGNAEGAGGAGEEGSGTGAEMAVARAGDGNRIGAAGATSGTEGAAGIVTVY
jgi:hypothetical protein